MKSPLSVFAVATMIFFGFSGVASASPKKLNLTISTKQNQSFSNLIKEAEAVAQEAIKQNFQSNKGITNIAVYVSGERNGQEVPLFAAAVSQSSWQKNPQIKSWIKYFRDAELLLGFVQGSSRNSNIAQVVNPSAVSINLQTPYPAENEPNFYQ